MVVYDSSIDTESHIKLVGINIEKICEILPGYSMQATSLDDMSLLDLTDEEILNFLGVTLEVDRIIGNTWEKYSNNSDIFIPRNSLILELEARKENHDKSKLGSVEKPYFDMWTPKLKDSTYDSEEYKTFLKELEVPLAHHYAHNRHHPEHFVNGIGDMNIVDIIEMLCDWKASCERHANGNIYESIETNQKRFGYTKRLSGIFVNTIDKHL